MDVVNIREGVEEFEATWSSEAENPLEHQEIDDLEIKVFAISPTAAYALCTSPDRRWCYANGNVDRAKTAETWVFVLTDDGWKIHFGQTAAFPVGQSLFPDEDEGVSE